MQFRKTQLSIVFFPHVTRRCFDNFLLFCVFLPNVKLERLHPHSWSLHNQQSFCYRLVLFRLPRLPAAKASMVCTFISMVTWSRVRSASSPQLAVYYTNSISSCLVRCCSCFGFFSTLFCSILFEFFPLLGTLNSYVWCLYPVQRPLTSTPYASPLPSSTYSIRNHIVINLAWLLACCDAVWHLACS